MQFTAALVALLPAVSAASTFGVQSRHSTSPVHLSSWSAAQNGIWNLRPEQGASCDAGVKQEFATFRLNDDSSLSLYKTDNPPQTLYVDRSGMGQGKIGFTTGVQPTPKNAETTGWAVINGQLTFHETGFLACPGYENGAYEIWLASVAAPAGNPNCTGISAAVLEIPEPVGCLYQA